MHATCIDCGGSFWREDNEAWKVRCLSCWKDVKAAKENARHDRAAKQSKHWNDTDDRATREYWRGWNAHRELIESESKPAIDKTRIRELLQLGKR